MTVVQQAVANGPTLYRRRRPEGTLLYRTVQTHFATWLALARDGQGDSDAVPGYVEREFRRYLECGILAHGFARHAGSRRWPPTSAAAARRPTLRLLCSSD
jgi:hypothetical protein